MLLYACARLGAMLVPLNWRLAVPEQVFILTDASVKVLVVEQGFAAVIAPLQAALPDARIVGLDFAPAGGVVRRSARAPAAATAATRMSISQRRC